MDSNLLLDFLQNAGEQPYRELVQHHIRRQSTKQLREGGAGTLEFLPENIQHFIMEFIDAANFKFGYDAHFWRYADCKTAFGWIIQLAINELPLGDWMTAEIDAYKPENQELAFNLFQIVTLNFAYSASTNAKQRKFMGIRKGLFR